MCRSVWSGLRGSLSLMYSSMHPLGGAVNRLERTLLNFFMQRGVRGGFFRVLGQCFTGKIGAAARRGWVVLPRNSGVFGWDEGMARRFSARRTVPGARGEKIFKNFLNEGWKTEKLGCERGREVVWVHPIWSVWDDF